MAGLDETPRLMNETQERRSPDSGRGLLWIIAPLAAVVIVLSVGAYLLFGVAGLIPAVLGASAGVVPAFRAKRSGGF